MEHFNNAIQSLMILQILIVVQIYKLALILQFIHPEIIPAMSQKFVSLNYQKYLNEQLASIMRMDVTVKQKNQMLEGFLFLLRQKQQVQKQKFKENLSTSLSEEQSNFTAYENEIEQLEETILQKRVVKFQINEEIEGIEEDLFQIERTVETKREYDEQLRKQIQQRMKNIEKNNNKLEVPKSPDRVQEIQQSSSYLNKSMGAVSGLFRGWIS